MGDRPRIVIIGAGATGRGQIGQLGHDAGFHVTFVDKDRSLVQTLASARRYVVGLAAETVQRLEVSGFDAYHVGEAEACARAIAEADIVATSVMPTNLRDVAPTVAAGIALRKGLGVEKPLNVIACENMERSSTTLRDYLRADIPGLDWRWIASHVGFPDSMVARAVPAPKDDPLFLLAETTQEWTVDANGIREPMPRLEGMTLTPDQEAALERKLYIKNTGHMAIGVLGFLRGYEVMDQAARDPGIFGEVDAATRESAAAVVAKHGFPLEETEHYRTSFLEAMKSPFLPDEIARVVREPVRKLGREERLVGPALLAIENGTVPVALAGVIANTFRIVAPEDQQAVQLQAMLERDGIEVAIETVCSIPRSHQLASLVRQRYESGKT